MPVGSAISPHLTRLARLSGINNDRFTWRLVPSVDSPGGSEDGSYEAYEAGAFLLPSTPTSTTGYVRAVGSPYLSYDFGVGSVDYQLEEVYAFHKEDWREVNNAEGLKRFERMIISTSKRFETAMEIRLRDTLWNAANYTNTGALTAANQFQLPGGDPFKEIRQRWDSIEMSAAYADGGVRTMWLNRTAFQHLASHARLTKFFKDGEATSRGTLAMVASELEIDVANLHVAKAVLNTANERQTPVYADVWAAASLWMGIVAPSIQENQQTSLARIYSNDADSVVERGENDTGEEKYRWARQKLVTKFVPVDVSAAYYYTTVYA